MFPARRRLFSAAMGRSANPVGVLHGFVESWRTVGDYWRSGDPVIDAMEVSTAGRIRGPRLDLTRGTICSRGYYNVRGAGSKRLAVHIIVARTWRGAKREELLAKLDEKKEFLRVEHWNQQFLDNRAVNLMWVLRDLHKAEGGEVDPYSPKLSPLERSAPEQLT